MTARAYARRSRYRDLFWLSSTFLLAMGPKAIVLYFQSCYYFTGRRAKVGSLAALNKKQKARTTI